MKRQRLMMLEVARKVDAEAQATVVAVLAETPLVPVPLSVLMERLAGLQLAKPRVQAILGGLQHVERGEGERVALFDEAGRWSTPRGYVLASYLEAAKVKASPWKKRRQQGVLEIVTSHSETPACAAEIGVGLELLFADEFGSDASLRPSPAVFLAWA